MPPGSSLEIVRSEILVNITLFSAQEVNFTVFCRFFSVCGHETRNQGARALLCSASCKHIHSSARVCDMDIEAAI
jgi:hypothetical protein